MRQQVVAKLTEYQALRCKKLRECLWPEEKLTVEEITRRLLLEHLLWQEVSGGRWSQCGRVYKALKKGKLPVDSHHAGGGHLKF